MKFIHDLLIVDDEPMNIDAISLMLEHYNMNISEAHDGAEALKLLSHHTFDVIISDVRMPNMNGLELLQRAKEIAPETDVIIVTAYGKIADAVNAIKLGAFDYLEKPFSKEELEISLEQLDRSKTLKEENKFLREQIQEKGNFHHIIGKSRPIQNIFDTIKIIAGTSATVLIHGKSGTGKELVANAIHSHSDRAQNNFVKLNCAALPENLIESEFFGYEKGAFTGAAKTHIGKFEFADNGSILLDEISEMRLDLQAKLLRFLQEKEFTRVGGNTPIHVDVRIIATTNKPLDKLVQEGKFREDLFYRLNVVKITVPSLHERKDDIPLLVTHFIKKYSEKYHRSVNNITDEAMQCCKQHPWPGNIRELENTIEQAVLFCTDTIIKKHHLHLESHCFLSPAIDILDTDISLAELEKQKIQHTLKKYDGNKTKAAEVLGVTTRTLRNKLKEYEEKDHN